MVATFFKKATLHAGRTYHSPDGDVPVTTDRLKHWEKEHAKLTKNKYIAPIDWDHAADIAGASPVKLSKGKTRSAKNTVGKLAGFKVAPDGSHAELLLEITDPQAKGRAERNEVYVSPVIFDNWKDGEGNQYKDVITHVDIVNHPVDNSQGPFVPVEPGTIACGLRMSLAGKGISRMAFPDDEEEGDEDTDTDPIEEGEESAAPESAEKNPDSPPKKANDETKTAAFIEGMARKNVVLPSDFSFDGDGFLDILVGCINSSIAAEQAAEADKGSDDEEDDPSDGDDVMQVQDPGYAAMSLQAKSAFSFAEKQYRGGIAQRMSSLLASGRCTPAEATAKEAEVRVVKLSLGADGEPAKSDLEKWIESREAVPEGTFWDSKVKTQKLSLQVHEPPTGAEGASSEEVDSLLDRAFGKR